jgi:hypothetical protein
MAHACIFTLPNPRIGPTATDLFRVKGMTDVVITVGGMEWRYPKGRACTTTQTKSGGELLGARLLRGDDAPVNLAAVPEAVAVAVDDGSECRIVWLGDGRCVETGRCPNMASARAQIEDKHYPADGYELPSGT